MLRLGHVKQPTGQTKHLSGTFPCLPQLCWHCMVLVSYCLAGESTPMLKSPVKTTPPPHVQSNHLELILCGGKALKYAIQGWVELEDTTMGISLTLLKLFIYLTILEIIIQLDFLPVRVISLDTLSIARTASAPSSQASMKNFSGVVCLRGQREHLELLQ